MPRARHQIGEEEADVSTLGRAIEDWLAPAGGEEPLLEWYDGKLDVKRSLRRIRNGQGDAVSPRLRKVLNEFAATRGLPLNGWDGTPTVAREPAYGTLTREFHDVICGMKKGALQCLLEPPEHTIYALELRAIDQILRTPYERPLAAKLVEEIASTLYLRQIDFGSEDGGLSYYFDWALAAVEPRLGATRGFVVQADGRLYLVGYNRRMDMTYLVLKPGNTLDLKGVAWAGFQAGTCDQATTGFARRVALLKGKVQNNGEHPLTAMNKPDLRYLIEWLACGVRENRNPAFAVDLR